MAIAWVTLGQITTPDCAGACSGYINYTVARISLGAIRDAGEVSVRLELLRTQHFHLGQVADHGEVGVVACLQVGGDTFGDVAGADDL